MVHLAKMKLDNNFKERYVQITSLDRSVNFFIYVMFITSGFITIVVLPSDVEALACVQVVLDMSGDPMCLLGMA